MNNRPIQSKKKIVENLMTAGIVIGVIIGLIFLTIFLMKNVLFQKDTGSLNANFSSSLKKVQNQSVKIDSVPDETLDTITAAISDTPAVIQIADTIKYQNQTKLVTLEKHKIPVQATLSETDKSAIIDKELSKPLERKIKCSIKSSESTITPIVKNLIQVHKSIASKKYSNALLLMNEGKYREAINVFIEFREENQPNKDLLRQVTYNIARCQMNLYLAGITSGQTLINAWYNVQDVYQKNSSQYHEADSILSLFGAKK